MTFDTLARDLAETRTSSTALVEQALAAASAAPFVFSQLLADEARRSAVEADRRRAYGAALGPLDGIPVAVKDLIDIAGTRTVAGAAIRADIAPATVDAPVITAIRSVGLIPMGKTALNEFAFSGIGYNPHFGTPFANRAGGDARAPGGSSAGSAIAVERGIVPAAIGSDTGGSVRVPSAFNGIVGFKTTRGRYPMDGVFPLARSFDTLGPMAASVRDCAWLDAAMRGRADIEVTSAPPAGIVFDPRILDEDGTDEAVRANTLAVVERLRAAGIAVEPRAVAAFDATRKATAELGWLGGREAYELHRETIAAHGERMDPRVVKRLQVAGDLPAENFEKLRALRITLIADIRRELGDALLLTPTTRIVAPLLAPLLEDLALFTRTNAAALALTMPGNFLDMPGVAMPSGTDGDGNPTSVLLSTGAGGDDRVLGNALWLEAQGILGTNP